MPPHSPDLSRVDSTKPFNGERSAAGRKQERTARREVLYGIVREAMVRAGVLSSSYKFKVLSLDPRGLQFLVMVDLAEGAGNGTAQLAAVEASIAQAAKRREITVTAVYWRSVDHVAGADARALQRSSPTSRPTPLHAPAATSAPAPLFEEPSRPAELHAEVPRPQAGFEPLHPDEVAAFKRALALGVSGPAAAVAASRAVQRQGHNHALLTGFEDTEMADGPTEAERLSGTQYGELR